MIPTGMEEIERKDTPLRLLLDMVRLWKRSSVCVWRLLDVNTLPLHARAEHPPVFEPGVTGTNWTNFGPPHAGPPDSRTGKTMEVTCESPSFSVPCT
jgi:hypothetical protein